MRLLLKLGFLVLSTVSMEAHDQYSGLRDSFGFRAVATRTASRSNNLEQCTLQLIHPVSPPPWAVFELVECFRIDHANGHPVSYVYYDQEPDRGANSHRMTKDGARRIAANIAKLPDLLARKA